MNGRDYIIAAFRYYAAVESKRAVPKTAAEKKDVEAVEQTFFILRKQNKEHIVNAVKEIYFPDAGKAAKRETYGLRVKRVAYDTPTTERTVYRWINKAIEICARFRGLRV